MLGPDHIRPLAPWMPWRHCPAGADADIYLTASEQALTRFANNRIHQKRGPPGRSGPRPALPLANDRGRAVTNNLSADGLADAVRQAADFARLMPEDPDFSRPCRNRPAVQSVAAYDAATASCDAERRGEVAGMVCRKAAELALDAAGFCRTGATELAVVSTRGADAYHVGFLLRPAHHRPQRRLGRAWSKGRRLAHGRDRRRRTG